MTIAGTPGAAWRREAPSVAPLHRGGLPPFMVRRVEAFVENRLGGKITLDELAALAGLSSAYFCRSFHRSTGCTPMFYVRRRRVHLAKHLIATTDLTMADIAPLCGFDHRSAMAKAFRLVGERPPLQCRG